MPGIPAAHGRAIPEGHRDVSAEPRERETRGNPRERPQHCASTASCAATPIETAPPIGTRSRHAPLRPWRRETAAFARPECIDRAPPGLMRYLTSTKRVPGKRGASSRASSSHVALHVPGAAATSRRRPARRRAAHGSSAARRPAFAAETVMRRAGTRAAATRSPLPGAIALRRGVDASAASHSGCASSIDVHRPDGVCVGVGLRLQHILNGPRSTSRWIVRPDHASGRRCAASRRPRPCGRVHGGTRSFVPRLMIR